MKKTSKIVGKIFLYFLLFISILIIFSTFWVKDTFGLVDLDKLIFHLNVSLEGTSNEMIKSFLVGPLLKSCLVFLGMIIVLNYHLKYSLVLKFNFWKKMREFNVTKNFKYIFSILLFIFSIVFFSQRFEVRAYFESLTTYTTFIEDNYVDSNSVKITSPDNKRNLIHIFLESMEFTYASLDEGGAMDENLIPHLSEYATSETSFRNSQKGGFLNSRATGWTIAGMTAQTAGIGFLVPGDGNEYGNYEKFLPGAVSLGELLAKDGYNQTLLIGSDASFGGRAAYFTKHGNYTIKDYNYAIENNWIADDYYVWWGYEDSKLFEFAKNELLELAGGNEPFNLTLLTTNTHHIGGYLEDSCEVKYEEKLKNVVLCSDKQVYEFVEWVKQQSFYSNTTIVITGDHLSMEPTFFDSFEDYERTNYNVFINPYQKARNENNRDFNSMDIYPTILASLGYAIEGDKLGLGTNLFSKTPTLYEKYGIIETDKELSYNSMFFKNYILYGNKE